MSKIGRQPILIPEGISVQLKGNNVTVVGPKGTLSKEFSKEVSIEIKNGKINVYLKKNTSSGRAAWGTTRSVIANMIEGVVNGWSKRLELVGTGYRVEVQDNTLLLTVGYSHPIKVKAPEGINFKVEKTIITVEGPDKELVGQVAAAIRNIRPPEPYKGKGIKYQDEVIRRKAGKAAKTIGAPTQ